MEEATTTAAPVSVDGDAGDGSANLSSLADCMVMPVESKVWSTVCEGILSVIVGVCGLMGNGATIAVLSRPAFKETFHKLLVSLSVFDSLFIASVALYGSIYTTMAVSIERFLGVCYPVQSRTRPRRHLLKYLLPVAFFAVGMNVPKAFESILVSYTDRSSNSTVLSVVGRNWTHSELYSHYYKVWSNLIMTTVLPLAVLVVCNVGIFVTLRRSRKTIRRSAVNGTSSNASNAQAAIAGATNNSAGFPSASPAAAAANNVSPGGGNNSYHHHQHHGHQQRNENALALILVGIVLVFVLCHSLRFFLAFYYVSVARDTYDCIHSGRNVRQPQWLFAVTALNHLALMINSSVNFIIYCAVGSRFRSALTCKMWGGGGGGSSRYNNHNCNSYFGSSLRRRWRRGGSGTAVGGVCGAAAAASAAVGGGSVRGGSRRTPTSPPVPSGPIGMTTVGISEQEVTLHPAPTASNHNSSLPARVKRQQFHRESGIFIEEEEEAVLVAVEEEEEAAVGVEEEKRQTGMRMKKLRLLHRLSLAPGGGQRKKGRSAAAAAGGAAAAVQRRQSSLSSDAAGEESSALVGNSRLSREPTKSSRTSADTQNSSVDVWL